jgi:hypothetical protein
MWGALPDERMGLSFTIVAGARQRSHSRIRVPLDSQTYITVSDSRLPSSSPPTTRRATVEVFDPASTRVSAEYSVLQALRRASAAYSRVGQAWSIIDLIIHVPTAAVLSIWSLHVISLSKMRPRYFTLFTKGIFSASNYSTSSGINRSPESESELLYHCRFTANRFVLATTPLRLTTSNFIFQLNTCNYNSYVIFSLTGGWVRCLQLLLVLASAVILRFQSCGTHATTYWLRFETLNLEGQVPVFISPRNRVAQLYPQALGKSPECSPF